MLLVDTFKNPINVITGSFLTLWHNKLRYPNPVIFKLLSNVIPSLVHCITIDTYTISPLPKQTSFPFNKESTSIISQTFELVHCDIWGLFCIPTQYKQSYFLTIVNKFSSCTWTYLLQHKSNVNTTFP